MIRRQEGSAEIFNRVEAASVALGIKHCIKTPTKPIDENNLPCIFMIEGTDEVISDSGRTRTGYPVKRSLEVILEIVTNRGSNIYDLYRGVRSAVFINDNPVVADGGTFIRELRTEGPTGYGLPDVVGIKFVLAMNYSDEGN